LRALAGGLGVLAILIVLLDGFEAMILPRRVSRKIRLAKLFYLTVWGPWSAIASRLPPKRRNLWLAWFGPFSLLMLFTLWAKILVVAFAALHWAAQTPMQSGPVDFAGDLYFSGVTFFTLGFGDVTPIGSTGRILAVGEAGLGFAFLALVIGYMPTIYQTFSRREVMISMLDARAGSPPCGSQVLIRMSRAGALKPGLDEFFGTWEQWCAELLEATISYPVIAYYRSQHDNQSWLAALTAMLDATAMAIANESGATNTYQAQVTFAVARHAVVDIALLFGVPPDKVMRRLDCSTIRRQMELAGFGMISVPKLDDLRAMYEPFLNGLSRHFLSPLPPIASDSNMADNWQSSAWMKRVGGLDHLGDPIHENEHFD
jgi:hypothetical protein